MVVNKPRKNSIILMNEYVDHVLELESDKMIISVAPTDVLIVLKWDVIHRVHDPSMSNI